MHGRVKTISSEEQQRKQKEAREVKLKMLTSATSKIFMKRKNEEYDDEALNLTSEVLMSNPNIITFWNYRKEILVQRNKILDADYPFELELSLTETCLRSDPKSYGTWHHRQWVLDNLPNDAWKKELKLCNKLLSQDERNFHCWDFRKILVQRAGIAPMDEYNFTTTKIESNFSNYSAWHWRSKILPQLFEDPVGKFPVEEGKYKQELELVQNAAFTDPDDQSAWFYQRWLLNMLDRPIGFIWAQATPSNVSIAFSRRVGQDVIKSLSVYLSDSVLGGSWQSLSSTNYSASWRFHFENNIEDGQYIDISLEAGSIPKDKITVKCNESEQREPCFVPQYSPDLKEILEDQLASCKELLDLEPDSKWTLLTSALLMRYTGFVKFGTTVISYVKKLSEIDKLRRAYYNDLASRLTIELALSKNPVSYKFELVNSNLHCLYHTQYFSLAAIIDLSGNFLTNTDLEHLQSLVNCIELNLSNNLITSALKLPMLERLVSLGLAHNDLACIEQDLIYLSKFPNLDIVKIKNDFQ